MLRDVNLIERLPQFVQVYNEIKGIMDAESPEVQALADESEVIKNNQFIVSSNISGIERFENMLGITPLTDDTLHSRIARVISYWDNGDPYTYEIFKQRMTDLFGADRYTLDPNFKNYELNIDTRFDLIGQQEDLNDLLDYMIPANIMVNVNNRIIGNSYHTSYASVGMSICQVIAVD